MKIQAAQLKHSTPVRSPIGNSTPKLAEETRDSVSLGASIKDGALQVARAGKNGILHTLRAGAGVVGATVGAALGGLPGMAYGFDRLINPDMGSWGISPASRVDTCWKLSYTSLGAVLAGGAMVAACGQGAGALLAAIAGGALGASLQGGFRMMGDFTTRLPRDTKIFPATLTHCADQEMGASIRGPISGALIGTLEGARLGKRAFQDLLVPALRPAYNAPYKA